MASNLPLIDRLIPGLADSLPGDIRSRLDDVGTILTEITRGVDETITYSAQETVDKLETALAKVHTAAGFIRGDFDICEVDERKDVVLQDAVSAFEQAEQRADNGLIAISEFHAKTVELQNTRVASIKDEISQMVDRNAADIRSIQSQIDAAGLNTRALTDSVEKQSQAVRDLESKLPGMTAATTAVDVVRFIPIVAIVFTIVGAANGNGIADPFGLHRQLDDTRRSRDQAQEALNNAHSQLNHLRGVRDSLETKLKAQKCIQESLPKLQGECQETESRCIALQTRFAPLKDSSSKLLRKAKELQNEATLANFDSYKDQFAVRLLQICNNAAGIHPQLTDSIRRVKDDITTTYEKALPDGVSEASKQIEYKLNGSIPGNDSQGKLISA
ncbi:hypothetical protein AAE478_010073 [Parahypoxylon ruwenzoriense]